MYVTLLFKREREREREREKKKKKKNCLSRLLIQMILVSDNIKPKIIPFSKYFSQILTYNFVNTHDNNKNKKATISQ